MRVNEIIYERALQEILVLEQRCSTWRAGILYQTALYAGGQMLERPPSQRRG